MQEVNGDPEPNGSAAAGQLEDALQEVTGAEHLQHADRSGWMGSASDFFEDDAGSEKQRGTPQGSDRQRDRRPPHTAGRRGH